MAVYKFPYAWFPCGSSPAFPQRKRILRPVVSTTLIHKDVQVPVLALLDSGADDCIFPHQIGVQLGLKVEEGLLQTFAGAGSKGNRAYFHSLKLIVGGQISLSCRVGFTKAMDEAGLGLLGQTGFFDHFRVTFDYQTRLILLRSQNAVSVPV